MAKLEGAIQAEVKRVAAQKKELGFSRVAEWPPDARDYDELFLGGIELTEIPKTDEELLAETKLMDFGADNALSNRVHAYDLTVQSGAADELVQNTLPTMIAAQQIEYLRKSALVGNEWKIRIEVHYIRKRSKNRPQFHKDTLGQTLFVNLNYVTDLPVAGAEYMVNPHSHAEWDEVISRNLPPEFYDDLVKSRSTLPELTTIGASDIPAHGVLAFVDEAIHHRTPVLGHRVVPTAQFEEFLLAEFGQKRVTEAGKAYDTHLESRWPFYTYSGENRKWLTWIAMTRQAGATYTRVDLTKAGVDAGKVDRLVEAVDRSSRTVSIAKLKGGKPQDIVPDEEERGRRPPLKRQLSERALKKQLPPDVEGDRKFFRNWVRAVRV